VVTLRNLQDGSGAYPLNAAPGTVSPSTSRITPTGFEGQSGTPPGGALLAVNNLSDVADPVASRTHLGLGTAATHAEGDFFQVANNLSEGVAATKRTNLGLGSAAVDDAGVTNGKLPPIDTTFTNGDSVWATAAGLQTKTQAQALLALGIATGTSFLYALLQDQHPSATESGNFTSGSWTKIPVNTEVSDPGNIVTLAASVATLATGTYRIRAKVIGYQVDKFQARLFNDSDGTVEFYGSNAAAAAAVVVSGVSFIEGRLVVAGGPKNYELQGQCQTTNATSGFGKACGFGNTEVYATWEIGKEV
jgi:hypothetical protein